MQFWPISGPYDPLKSTLHHQQSMLNGSYSPKRLYKLVLPENGFTSIFFELKMFKKCPKCHISCNSAQFLEHITHSKASYSTKRVLLRAHILPKLSINQYYQEMYSFLSFLYQKCSKSAQNVILHAILTNFWTI